MTLDKIDLIDRKFAKSLLGYSRDDVDSVVAEAAETIGRLAEEKMALGRRVEELRREVAGYQAREATLRDTLLTTQTIVEDVKAKAKHDPGPGPDPEGPLRKGRAAPPDGREDADVRPRLQHPLPADHARA